MLDIFHILHDFWALHLGQNPPTWAKEICWRPHSKVAACIKAPAMFVVVHVPAMSIEFHWNIWRVAEHSGWTWLNPRNRLKWLQTYNWGDFWRFQRWRIHLVDDECCHKDRTLADKQSRQCNHPPTSLPDPWCRRVTQNNNAIPLHRILSRWLGSTWIFQMDPQNGSFFLLKII